MNSLSDVMHESWAQAMEPVANQIHAMGDFLREEDAAGRGYLPNGERVLRAFTTPVEDVRVLIVGQDPYPTPGHAVGLSFSVERTVRPLPRSLANIFSELESDVGCPPSTHGDLSSWADQGVMLLNRVLSVTPSKAGSHAGKGWEQITDHAIKTLADRGGPLVAILWGRQAQSLEPLLGEIPIIKSAHPSPLSARRGFFGSKPFSRANSILEQQGAKPIDWTVS